MNRAILLSGGLDSIALMYLEKPSIAITIDYGQKCSKAELNASVKVCKILNIKHIKINIDCSKIGSGDLFNNRPLNIGKSEEWWPFRNQLIITIAAIKAITLGVQELLIGTVKSDDQYRDGTSEFFSRVNDLISYQEGGIKISAPAINLSSIDLIKKSKIPNDILYWAHSCNKNNVPCGLCDSCLKYIQTMEQINNMIKIEPVNNTHSGS